MLFIVDMLDIKKNIISNGHQTSNLSKKAPLSEGCADVSRQVLMPR